MWDDGCSLVVVCWGRESCAKKITGVRDEGFEDQSMVFGSSSAAETKVQKRRPQRGGPEREECASTSYLPFDTTTPPPCRHSLSSMPRWIFFLLLGTPILEFRLGTYSEPDNLG